MNKNLLLLVLVLSIAGGSCGKREEPPPEKVVTVSGVKVEAVKVSPREEFYEAAATVRSKRTSTLSSKVLGAVTSISVREGDRVQAGQLLLEIDSREAAARLRKARAGLREAKEMLEEVGRTVRAHESARTAAQADQALAASTFNRYQALLERKSVSRQEFDEAQARFRAKSAEVERVEEMLRAVQARREQALARIEQAQAEISQAELHLEDGRIRAPFQGIVAQKAVEVGALAAPGTPLLTLEDDRHYRLEAAVEESRVGRIRLGDSVRVSIDALGGGEHLGRVGEIQPSADPASRSSLVKIDLPQNLGREGPARGLRSGLYGKARFSLGKREVLTVPRGSVLERGQLQQVWEVDSSQVARLRLVKTGKTYGERVEILAGLREGERIVAEGGERVKEGNRIEEKRD